MSVIDPQLEKYFTITHKVLGKDTSEKIDKLLEPKNGDLLGIIKESYQTATSYAVILNKIANLAKPDESGITKKPISEVNIYIMTNSGVAGLSSPKDFKERNLQPLLIQKKVQDQSTTGKAEVEIYKTPYLAIFSNSSTVLPSVTKSRLSELYMSSINQLELSKMFPYVNVQFSVKNGVENFLNLGTIINGKKTDNKNPFKTAERIDNIDDYVSKEKEKQEATDAKAKANAEVAAAGAEAERAAIKTAEFDNSIKEAGQQIYGVGPVEFNPQQIKNIKKLSKEQKAAVAKAKTNAQKRARKKYEDLLKKTTGESLTPRGFGMEVFTSPQTMVPDYHDQTVGGASGKGGLKDPFSSFMSIQSFAFTIKGGIDNTPMGRFGLGFVIDSAILRLQLHDKSRLQDVLSLLKQQGGIYGPDGGGNIDIEFGYYHQDELNEKAFLNSPFARLVKAQRIKKRFTIRQVDFTITNTGTVDIELRLRPPFSQETLKSINIGARASDMNDLRKNYENNIEALKKTVREQSKNADFEKVFAELGLKQIIAEHSKNIKTLSFLDYAQTDFEAIFKKANDLLKKQSPPASVKSAIENVFKKIQDFHYKETKGARNPNAEGVLRKVQNSNMAYIEEVLTFKPNNEEKFYKNLIDENQYELFSTSLLNNAPDGSPYTSKQLKKSVELLKNAIRKRIEQDVEVKGTGSAVEGKPQKKKFTNRDAIRKTILLSLQGKLRNSSGKAKAGVLQYVSFAHVIQKLVINELMSTKDAPVMASNPHGLNFSEIQLYVYRCNKHAGYMEGKNLGGFLIDYQLLYSRIMDQILRDGKVKLSLHDVLQILQKFFADPDNIMYKDPTKPGVIKKYAQDIKTLDIDPRTARRKSFGKQQNKKPKQKEKNKKEKTKSNFKPVKLAMITDTIKTKQKTTALRIVFYDEEDSTYESAKKSLAAIYEGQLDFNKQFNKLKNEFANQLSENLEENKTIGRKLYNASKRKNDKSQEILKRATTNEKDKFKEQTEKLKDNYQETVKALGGPLQKGFTNDNEKRLKGLLKSIVPTIHPYAESSLIQEISFKKSTSKGVEDAVRSVELRKNKGARIEGPADKPKIHTMGKIDVKMVGNLFMKSRQEFYFDLETGTELDNIYLIGSVSHTIDKSGITTSFDATRRNSYYNNLEEKLSDKYKNQVKDASVDNAFNDLLNNAKKKILEVEKKKAAQRAAAAAAKRAAALKYEVLKGFLGTAAADDLIRAKKLANQKNLSPREQKFYQDYYAKLATQAKYTELRLKEEQKLYFLKQDKNPDPNKIKQTQENITALANAGNDLQNKTVAAQIEYANNPSSEKNSGEQAIDVNKASQDYNSG